MKTIYVKAKSKKAINERLLAGEMVSGTEYGMYGNASHYLRQLEEDAVIKVFDKYVNGTPYAKAYGTYSVKKRRVL